MPARRSILVRSAHIAVLAAISSSLIAAFATLPGCVIGAVVGGMVESYRQSSTHAVEAEYIGLEGKSYAVVVAADRLIQADHPGVVSVITDRINQRIYQNTQANGFIPTQTLLTYLLNRPQWTTLPLGQLANDLGVDRLIYIELWEYRLNDPGNDYLWAGVASGNVAVIEADGYSPDEYAFEQQVQVQFPDSRGYGPAEMPRKLVTSALVSRFIDRASWLLYDHQEPYYPEY